MHILNHQIIFFILCPLYIFYDSKCAVLDASSIRDEIVETLFANYQSHVRPGELIRNTTVVTVYISVSAITSVDVRNMEYTIDMLLRQAWYDPRLAWDQIEKFKHYTKNIVSPVFKEKIWLPDLFFRNACITFNSGVLLEFAIASHLARRQKVSEWQVEVRKLVRRELARWCSACQLQYAQRGPSALSAYSASSRSNEKVSEYINSVAAAAFAIQNSPVLERPSPQMSVRLTKSGLMSMANIKSGKPDKVSKGVFYELVTNDSALTALDTTQKDALLPTNEPQRVKKPASMSKIDSYSRFVFPACFLLYNCFYWLYYLVIVKHK
ncbi:unnamed protein product [Schistosoma mattheei]|uniref:Neur_chan_LBD domain-containing protein n=1 Tax=Schistosoma mattheei TaxID=31246 RepID=A0AA85BQE5_9TREM|nr:unnamed protein product [Schistosoma mattheei]